MRGSTLPCSRCLAYSKMPSVSNMPVTPGTPAITDPIAPPSVAQPEAPAFNPPRVTGDERDLVNTRDFNPTGVGDVDKLRRHGLTDAEIFDIVATVAARAFFPPAEPA